MPFSKEFDDVYQLGIKPACEEAGAFCERLDEQVFDEGMLDQIYIQIAKADMIVADMSTQNPNVFYEVGYAHALDKRVILITNSAGDIPFDLKHRFHLVYEKSITTLRARLKDRISWYVEHPADIKLEACDHLQFQVEGKSPDEPGVFVVRRAYLSGRMGYQIDVAIHNPPDAKIGVVTFTPSLLFPSFLVGKASEQLAPKPYIRLAGDVCVLQHPQPITLQPGGWISISFEIEPGELCHGLSQQHLDLVLRVLSDGPPRDVPFKAQVLD